MIDPSILGELTLMMAHKLFLNELDQMFQQRTTGSLSIFTYLFDASILNEYTLYNEVYATADYDTIESKESNR